MAVTVRNNPELGRYEAIEDGEVVGFAEYRVRPEAIIFIHTQVDEAMEGKGVGGLLAKTALEDVRAKGGVVVPLCPFIASYLERHPEYADLVAERTR